MMSSSFDVKAAARRLVAARNGDDPVQSEAVAPPDIATAWAVQDATLELIGPAGGWKVGAKAADAQPGAAPLPASGIFASGASLAGPPWSMRGIEVEVAVRFGRDFVPGSPDVDVAQLQAAIDCVLPAIEVVETRLADWRESGPLAQLADLQTHGALVLGEPSGMKAADIDLRQVEAYLAFDGQPVASCRGANVAVDVWRLLTWLAWNAAQRGRPLRAGDVVTTGSCSGMLYAGEGTHVLADLKDIGRIEIRF
ncbi:MAG TPA: fumarylacetoacetate hydrolase family protein [Ramlibacter sp.]|nr:fumarylacetoacetate hydrolase family protein [Ramlibacter sp.]